MKTVFILGAGASADAGAPVMSNFLQRARDLRRAGMLADCADAIQDVIDSADRDLSSLYAKSDLHLENIEDLFSAIEMGRIIGRYGLRSAEQIESLNRSIVTFLYRIVEESISLTLVDRSPQPTNSYGRLTKLVHDMLRQGGPQQRQVSFITFNYDTALEYALYCNRILPDYCLESELLEPNGTFDLSVPVLKLHGSINWAHCTHCQKIIPTTISFPAGTRFHNVPGSKEVVHLMQGSNLSRFNHEGNILGGLPYLVPPTWNKSIYPGMQSVWRRAADELKVAEKIIVIGFSLPESDKFFRYLFALGVMSETRIRQFIVFDIDPNVAIRFKALTGRVSAASFHPFSLTFSDALANLKQSLKD